MDRLLPDGRGTCRSFLAVAILQGTRAVGDSRYVGAAFATRRRVGFDPAIASIRLLPDMAGKRGMRGTFLAPFPGQAVGIIAMLRLRARPKAARIINGLR